MEESVPEQESEFRENDDDFYEYGPTEEELVFIVSMVAGLEGNIRQGITLTPQKSKLLSLLKRLL